MERSPKLSYLLRLLWNNPIFGDSYPSTVSQDTALLQIEKIYSHFLAEFRSILAEGMPHSSVIELNELLNQITPKTIAFCTAISAGEIDDVKRLRDATLAIAVSYWADQSMDRGDEAMLAAVRYIGTEFQKDNEAPRRKRTGHRPNPKNRKTTSRGTFDPNKNQTALPTSGLVKDRLIALRHIERLTQNVNDHPEDFPYMLGAIYRDVLAKQAHMRDLSRQYLITGGTSDFWDKHATDIAQTTLSNSGLMSAVTVIYSIYRHYQPNLPSLKEIYQHPNLMKLINGPFNGAIRIFDDLGDQKIDTGQVPHWGIFNLNLFNQPNIKLLDNFIKSSGVDDEALRDILITAFPRKDLASQIRVAKTYVGFLRQKVSNLPKSLWKKYGFFLQLCKRTLEAGFVNSLGDILLTEGEEMHMIKSEILSLLEENFVQDPA